MRCLALLTVVWPLITTPARPASTRPAQTAEIHFGDSAVYLIVQRFTTVDREDSVFQFRTSIEPRSPSQVGLSSCSYSEIELRKRLGRLTGKHKDLRLRIAWLLDDMRWSSEPIRVALDSRFDETYPLVRRWIDASEGGSGCQPEERWLPPTH